MPPNTNNETSGSEMGNPHAENASSAIDNLRLQEPTKEIIVKATRAIYDTLVNSNDPILLQSLSSRFNILSFDPYRNKISLNLSGKTNAERHEQLVNLAQGIASVVSLDTRSKIEKAIGIQLMSQQETQGTPAPTDDQPKKAEPEKKEDKKKEDTKKKEQKLLDDILEGPVGQVARYFWSDKFNTFNKDFFLWKWLRLS